MKNHEKPKMRLVLDFHVEIWSYFYSMKNRSLLDVAFCVDHAV